MSSSYPLRNDMTGPLCVYCGMVLPRNLYCTNCGYSNGSAQTDIAARETQPSPSFHLPSSDETSQSVQRPDHYNKKTQNISPPPQSQYPNVYAPGMQGTPSVTPFLGISPNIPSHPPLPAQYPNAFVPGTRGASSVTPFLGIAPQSDVSQTGFKGSSNGISSYPSSYATQPTLIVPVGLPKEQERSPRSSKPVSQHTNRNINIFWGILISIIVLVGGGLAGYLFIYSPGAQKSTQISKTHSSSQPKGPLKFADAFKNNKNQWNLQSEAGKYLVVIANGNLMLEDDNNSLLPEFLPGNRFFNNFKVTVDAVLSKGDAKNGYGLYIRCSPDQSGIPAMYYRFELYGDGTYAIFKGMANGHGRASPSPVKLVSYTTSSAIRKQGSNNHIEISAQGAAMTIRVNGQVLKTFSDPSYTKGTIALFISNIQNAPPGAQATFSNLSVYPS